MPLPAKEYIKRVTTVPEGFIDELFELYTDDSTVLQTDFVIKLSVVAKWLQAKKRTLVLTLKTTYTRDIDYTIVKPVDIVKKYPRNNNYKEYMLTPDCFKRLAMMSRSKNAELIRTYFIEVEGLFLKYRDQTLVGIQKDLEKIERQDKFKKSIQVKKGYIYIIKASEKEDGLYKIGRSKDLLNRIRTYNTGRAEDIDLLYIYEAPDIYGAEHCVKGFLKEYQKRKYKEVYEADLKMIKDLIKGCANLGAKLTHKQSKTKQAGGYYIVIDKEVPLVPL